MAFVMAARSKRRMAYIFIPAVLLLAALAAAYLASGSSIQALPAVPQPQTGDIQRISISSARVEGNAGSFTGGISADGRLVVFESTATNLVAGATNGFTDVFVHDRQTRQTTWVSVTSTGGESNSNAYAPVISANGRFVAFISSSTNLVAGDTNNVEDIFVHDRATGATTRVSVTSAGGQTSAHSRSPSISADGRYVAFHYGAGDLVTGDTNNTTDVFVHDRQTGETERVSVSSSEAEGNSASQEPSINADGRYVAFESYATNLVSASDTNNNRRDIFVRDRLLGTTIRASQSTAGIQGNAFHGEPSISGNGRFVGYRSNSTNLVTSDGNGTIHDVFVHDRVTGVTTVVSVNSDGNQRLFFSFGASLNQSGRFVAFYGASRLAPGDVNATNDVYLHDRTTGQTTLMSISTSGQGGNSSSTSPRISANGLYVAFSSSSIDLVPGDANGASDAFVNINLAAATCNGLAPTILGTHRADLLVGTAGPDVIMGFLGNDIILAGSGDDTICAGGGHDVVAAGMGDDTVFGGPGADSINAGLGQDTVQGGPGADGILGGEGDDLLDGNLGNDSILRRGWGRHRLRGVWQRLPGRRRWR